MNIQVVNVRDVNPIPGRKVIYVGRTPRYGGPHPLANPFRVKPWGPYERGEAVEEFRRWLWAGLRDEKAYMKIATPGRARILELLADIPDGAVLACHCAPEPCHADVIVAARTWAKKEGLI